MHGQQMTINQTIHVPGTKKCVTVRYQDGELIVRAGFTRHHWRIEWDRMRGPIQREQMPLFTRESAGNGT